MDVERFDALVTIVATRRGITRGLLGGGLLGTLAALAAPVFPRRAAADDAPRLVELAPAARPVLTEIRVEEVTPISAVVAWSTDVPADSSVEYGETAEYGLAVADPAPVTDHRIILTGLTA